MLSQLARDRIKTILPRPAIDALVMMEIQAQLLSGSKGRHQRECPICGYRGRFWAGGRQPIIIDAQCPKCRSIGRHRQHFLLVSRHPSWIDASDLLHFAPEPCLDKAYAARIKASGRTYVRADYSPVRGETKVDLQNIQFDPASFDTIICHNVLEHVPDDRQALREMRRVLRPGGRVLLSVPMIHAWATTYENELLTSESDRDLHFNQYDHFRLYGRDVVERIEEAGFKVQTDTALEPEVSRYALERGEIIFIAEALSVGSSARSSGQLARAPLDE